MNTFKNLMLVFLGGGIGSAFRYLIGKLFLSNSNSFPWGTFLANLTGCFLLGFFSNWVIKNFRSEWIIFFTIGITIGFIGSLFGLFLGIIFSINIQSIQRFIEKILNTKLFSEEIYYLSSLPSKISINEILLILITSIIIATVSTIFPALRSAKVDPIQSIKSE